MVGVVVGGVVLQVLEVVVEAAAAAVVAAAAEAVAAVVVVAPQVALQEEDQFIAAELHTVLEQLQLLALLDQAAPQELHLRDRPQEVPIQQAIVLGLRGHILTAEIVIYLSIVRDMAAAIEDTTTEIDMVLGPLKAYNRPIPQQESPIS